jgi:hypothetical protein
VLLALAASLSPLAAAAAQGGIVVGQVTDRGSSVPIEAARVQIGTTIAVATDARGHYVIRNVATGPQTVRVTRIGFRPASQAVTVSLSDSTRADFALSQSAVELGEVVVTGTGGAVEKRKLGSSMAVVDLAQMQEQNASTDIGQALSAKVPGLRSLGVGGGAGASKDLRFRQLFAQSTSRRLYRRRAHRYQGHRVDEQHPHQGHRLLRVRRWHVDGSAE